MTKEEKQKLRLERLYVNNDKLKDQRIKVPILINSLSLGVAGFLLKESQVLESNLIRVLAAIIIFFMGAFGAFVTFTFHRQYIDVTKRILYLYNRMDMANGDFVCQNSAEVIFAKQIWIGIYISYVIFSTLGILVVSIA